MEKSAAIAHRVLAEDGKIETPSLFPVEPRESFETDPSDQDVRHKQLDHEVHNPTVEPYKEAPEENPFQEDEPYAGEKGASSELLSLFREWDSSDAWFDGKSASVLDRIGEAEVFERRFRDALRAAESDRELFAYADVHAQVEGQLQTLRETAEVLSEGEAQEEFGLGGERETAAIYDNLVEGGLVELTDDGSWLYQTAKKVRDEVSAFDWEAFKTAGAEDWIDHQKGYSPQMLLHEVVTREAAIDYAKDKTMPLLDMQKRAGIIDAFVTNAEIHRRKAAQEMELVSRGSRHLGGKQAQVRAKVAEIIKDNPELLWL